MLAELGQNGKTKSLHTESLDTNKPVLIIDCHGLGHFVKAPLKDLSHYEQEIGVIYGFLRNIVVYAGEFKTNRLVFAWDSNTSKRKIIYPSYKDRRHAVDENSKRLNETARNQLLMLKECILPRLGFKNNFHQVGHEADDIIASIVKRNSYQFVIISSDNDLYQLLGENVSMFNYRKKELFTDGDFYAEYGIEPVVWADVKAIAGCNSDAVGGIDNIGIKTAIKFVTKTMNRRAAAFERILDGRDIIERNLLLVKLPLKGTETFNLDFDFKFNMEFFEDLCHKYNFQSLLKAKYLKKIMEVFS